MDISRLARSLVRSSKWLRPLRLARFHHIARTRGHEDWAGLLGPDLDAFKAAREKAWAEVGKGGGEGRRVLIATGMGGHFALNAIDRLLGVALTLRGAAVTIGLCDGVLGACQMCESNLFPDRRRFLARGPDPDLCGWCFAPSAAAHAALGLPVVSHGGLVDAAARREAEAIAETVPLAEMGRFHWQGVPVGDHARAGTLRFFARGDLEGEPDAPAVGRRYLAASIVMAMAARRLLETVRPDVVVIHHAIYVPQGIMAEVARRAGVRVVAWTPAYRKHCFLFSHDATYHHTMMDEPVEIWRDQPLSEAENDAIGRYLESRWHGANDWIRFHKDPDLDLTRDLAASLDLDPAKPVILALTNVFWDAQLHYPANAFASQRDWLIDTIAWFAERPELQLVIRVHPAEISGSPASRQLAAEEIAKVFPKLPANVRLVGPESPLSTYDLARQCDCAIIYATKTGVELTSVGIPVIVAGEAWIRGKGLTHDVASPAHYHELLARLPFGERLAPEVVASARRYAFHFFFRRMVPLDFVHQTGGARRFSTLIDGLAPLRPGASPGLDVICDGILDGTPFHMPSEAALR